jgi:hypothetical protein
VRVDESNRIVLPPQFTARVDWIAGEQALDGWLLVGSADRCRILSNEELGSDSELQKLQARITDEINAPIESLLDFREVEATALPLRLAPIEIKRHSTRWRLVIPQVVAVAMKIQPAQSDLVTLFLDGHIELWTVDTLRTAFNYSLAQLL